MNALSVLQDLARDGVRIRARDGRVEVQPPPGADLAEITAKIRPVKFELLELLAVMTRDGCVDSRDVAAVRASYWQNRLDPRKVGTVTAYERFRSWSGQGEAVN